MDAFNILLEEDIFRTNPQALEKLTGWVNARDAGRQPAAMYAMGSLLLAKDDLAGAVKMAEDGLSKYPQSLPVQTLSLNTTPLCWTKTAWKTRNALSPNIPERPPASSSSGSPGLPQGRLPSGAEPLPGSSPARL